MKEYKIFECIVCGWLYDESKGSPEDGIAAGTRWEDVPEDWHCPECGVSKQEFEMIELVSETATKTIQGEPTTQAPGDSKPTLVDPLADANDRSNAQFKLWECLVCGWLYDEAKGWPEDGIAPGTRWEDVPEDWICPECGVEKSDFEMLELSPNSAPDTPAAVAKPLSASLTTASAPPIVVIGTGLAGYNFVREFRKRDRSTPVVMLTQDDGRFYSKPLISTGYHRHKTADELATASAEKMAQELDAEIRIFTRVDSADTAARMVATPTGTIHYSKLVLATGARCIEAPLEGSGLDRIYTINDLLDYAKFRTAMVNKKKVLIIGAGLIGSEYANDLVQCGYELDIVDPLDSVLATLLPKAASDSVKNALQDRGVRFHFGTVVNSIDKRGSGVRASLANGDTVDADIVLSAIGVRANIKLAESMGLECNRGIVTDRTLVTSAENVYALGDCAEVDGHLLYFVAPLMECTRKLAATLCGEPAEVYYAAMPVTVKTTIYPVNVSPPQQGALGEWVIDIEQKSGVVATFRNAANELLGFATTGDCITASGELAEQLVPLMPKPQS